MALKAVERMPVSPATVASLPCELLFEIFAYLQGDDIINFLSTSHTYRALVATESIWHEVCSRYGVRDLTSFRLHGPTRSFYTIYTDLLHTYGPLLGLWASDNPFDGNVLEFRIVTESQEVGWEGIIGEVWRFPDSESLTSPTLPDFHECLRIELLPWQPCSPSTSSPDTQTRGRFAWTIPECSDGHIRPAPLTSTTDIICRFSPHRLSHVVSSGTPEITNVVHPPFPPPHLGHLWSDAGRLPRLAEHEEVVDNDGETDYGRWLRSVTRIVYLLPAPRSPLMPRSITVLSPLRSSCYASYGNLHSPPRPVFADLRKVSRLLSSRYSDPRPSNDRVNSLNGHYFPLPFPPVKHDSDQPGPPVEIDWSPQSLGGLWLGSCQKATTEVMFLIWESEAEELQAWKITGNYCVPRGAMSWKFSPSMRIWAGKNTDILTEMGFSVDGDALKLRMFEGTGTIADEGFPEETRGQMKLEIAIASQDEIRIRWTFEDGEHDVLIYRRYFQRHVGIEKVLVSGVRSSNRDQYTI